MVIMLSGCRSIASLVITIDLWCVDICVLGWGLVRSCLFFNSACCQLVCRVFSSIHLTNHSTSFSGKKRLVSPRNEVVCGAGMVELGFSCKMSSEFIFSIK